MSVATVRTFMVPMSSTLSVRLSSVRDMVPDDGVPIEGATVRMTLRDAAGATVAGAVDVPLLPVTTQPNTYLGALPHTLSVVRGAPYLLTVTAVASDGREGAFRAALVFY